MSGSFGAAHFASFFDRAHRWWSGLNLFQKFILASSLIPLFGMLFVGSWVAGNIEDAVVQSLGASAALYTDALIEPHVQDLAVSLTMTPENMGELERHISPSLAGKHIIGLKIWKGDTVAFSLDKKLIGQTFPPSAVRERAWRGDVSVAYNSFDESDLTEQRAGNLPLLEFYAPIRKSGSRTIIALAETYEAPVELDAKIASARQRAWRVVLAATAVMLMLQAAVVSRGSDLIAAQRRQLDDKVARLSHSLSENEHLRHKVNQANQRVTETNERFLHRLGSDLHDGPVQLLGMSLLRLDSLKFTLRGVEPPLRDDALEDVVAVHEALTESLGEIRSLSSGLAPPEVGSMPATGVLRLVAQRHARRTGLPVKFNLADLPDNLPYTLKACLFRFVQEGLNNAFRHAGGAGQQVKACFLDGVLEVEVSDTGPGLGKSVHSPNKASCACGGQGLAGLRDRVESLGGEFVLRSERGQGTHLAARFKLSDFANTSLSEGIKTHV